MADDKPKPSLSALGTVPLIPISNRERTLKMCIWGNVGAGKTPLAATMPGKKLWLNFDPDGDSTITHRDDVMVVDFSKEDPQYVEKFRDPNPMNIGKLMEQNGINSCVFDSATAFSMNALQYGVEHASKMRQHRDATLEDPGYGGYGRRKVWTTLAVQNVLRECNRRKIHFCVVSHEDTPDKDNEGQIVNITMMLGSDLAEKVGLQISEIWHLRDTGDKRIISLRPFGRRKPIRTRMFDTEKVSQIEWKYDIDVADDKQPEHTIAGWYARWQKNKYEKIKP